MDLKEIRIDRLKRFAKSRNVLDDPAGLGSLIGKKPNQVYNLLNGMSSFGEKVARSIEEAAGLPRYWLDTEESPLGQLPPEVAEIAMSIARLPQAQRDWVIATTRSTIDAARETIRLSSNGVAQTDEGKTEGFHRDPAPRVKRR